MSVDLSKYDKVERKYYHINHLSSKLNSDLDIPVKDWVFPFTIYHWVKQGYLKIKISKSKILVSDYDEVRNFVYLVRKLKFRASAIHNLNHIINQNNKKLINKIVEIIQKEESKEIIIAKIKNL